MSKPTARQCAELAYQLASGGQTIPYVYGGTGLAGLDCRGYVLYIIRTLGGTVRFVGATDLWNNYLQYKDTTAEHVGWYTGIRGNEVAHASQRNGKVVLSPLSSYYGHVGWAEAVDYGDAGVDSGGGEALPPEPPVEQPAPGQAIVNTRDGTLTLRKGAGTSYAPIASMPKGTQLDVLRLQTGADGQAWAEVRWDVREGLHHIGWCAARYLMMGGEEVPGPSTSVHIAVIDGYQGGEMSNDDAVAILAIAEKMGYSGTVRERDD